jgi:hypothetical protein
VGFDTDAIALRAARRRSGGRGETHFFERELGAADVEEWQPDVAVLAGLLHHIDDPGCVALLELLKRSPRLRRVTTLDVSFFPDRFYNNLLTILDRGQYPRRPGGYVALAERAGYQVEEGVRVGSRPGSDRVSYWVMSLTPER